MIGKEGIITLRWHGLVLEESRIGREGVDKMVWDVEVRGLVGECWECGEDWFS